MARDPYAGSLAPGAHPTARLEFETERFNAQVQEAANKMHKNAQQYVLSMSRVLVKRFAWYAPIKTGRLRAGFWPIAVRLGIWNIYTPHPNINEGYGDASKLDDRKNPMVRFGNTVDYVANAGKNGKWGTTWWWKALADARARMDKQVKDYLERPIT